MGLLPRNLGPQIALFCQTPRFLPQCSALRQQPIEFSRPTWGSLEERKQVREGRGGEEPVPPCHSIRGDSIYDGHRRLGRQGRKYRPALQKRGGTLGHELRRFCRCHTWTSRRELLICRYRSPFRGYSGDVVLALARPSAAL